MSPLPAENPAEMWHLNYRNKTKAMDIILIMGLNFHSPNNIIMERMSITWRRWSISTAR